MAGLPAIPTPFRAVGDEPYEPDDERNGGDPPQDVESESGAKQQKRDDEKRNKQSHIPSLNPLAAVLPGFISFAY